MPRILVADDNSNIHRTIALALKEAGVEVVAVGNGEAAVRKIAEIRPDLVLADIFMPVRSGYEVCEFVKRDARFAGVPVVLLIGAFDPFDEREAQRVQADAILKKPFVPPDSLVRTVADLLALSASRPKPAAAAAAPPPPPAAAAPPTEEFLDEPPELFEVPKARLEWDSGEQPVAFGSLLGAVGSETEADDSVITSQRDPNLGEPAFWTQRAQPEEEQAQSDSDDVPAETAVEFSDEEQWRLAGDLEEPHAQAKAAAEITQPLPPNEAQEGELELPEIVLPVKQLTETPAQMPVEPLPALTEQLPSLAQLPELESSLVETPAALSTVESFPEASAPILATSHETPEREPDLVPELKEFAWTAPSYSAERTETVPEPVASPEIDSSPENTSSEPPVPAMATLAPFLARLTSEASSRTAETLQDPVAFDSVPAFPSDFRSEPVETEPAKPVDTPADSQPDPAVIEAIAQRVIERMQPKIIELVTRELLRPVVEALVQRELEKK